MSSLSAEETIQKARECYALGLISEGKMEDVVKKESTIEGYNAITDLPFDYEVEHELKLRRAVERRARKGRLLRFLRRAV